jgi:hypothetical protein
VNASGQAISVKQGFAPCVVLGTDGKVIAPIELSKEETDCASERLRSWRFAAFNTCGPQMANVDMVAEPPPDARAKGKGRTASRGGPTARCG